MGAGGGGARTQPWGAGGDDQRKCWSPHGVFPGQGGWEPGATVSQGGAKHQYWGRDQGRERGCEGAGVRRSGGEERVRDQHSSGQHRVREILRSERVWTLGVRNGKKKLGVANWNILEYIGIYWNILKYIGIYQNILEYIGIYCNIMKYIGIY